MKGPPLKLNNEKISSELLTLYVIGGPALLKEMSVMPVLAFSGSFLTSSVLPPSVP